MSNIIDLDAIIDIKYETSFGRAEVHKFMREAIEQALILAAERGRVYYAKHDSNVQPGTISITVRVDKASIMEVIHSIK